MSKFCCCPDPELPDITVNVTCACCESQIDDHQVNDSSSLDISEEQPEKEEDTICCCCFKRKRHAKLKKKKGESQDGSRA